MASRLSHPLSVNVIVGDYPITSKLSRYWYGDWGPIITNNWGQIDSDIVVLIELDTAMSISW
jgi:hypothetical protein